jgi:cytochrome c-type biogenesis protein CcmF
MNASLGTLGVVVGFVGSVLAVVTLGWALLKRRADVLPSGAWFAVLLFVAALASVLAMEHALIVRDFTVKYVHDNGSSRTPRLFNIATLWSSLEGSILLWVLILSGFIGAVVWKFRKRLEDPLVGWALLTMFAVAAFFFGLMLGPANPFRRISPPAGYDGPGPNPLLQNNLLVAYHPPMLYLGFVGFTVPFAFAIAALVTGRVGEGWLLETRRWTLFAWGFLTAGIILGAWWSYQVLGWGGYWAWDPVENASFLPWLTGTAFLHSVMVQERRGMLRVWNLSLVCATFSLTILGTFLTRSGVLESVHAFSNSSLGPLLLGFFGVIVVVSLGLIAWRGDRLRSPGGIDSPVSREGAFLVNNLLFAGFALVVLLGTVFPLIVEAVRGDRISVGAPYFNRLALPIAITLLFLMAVAPVLPWRKASTETLRKRLLIPAWLGAAAIAAAELAGARGIGPLVAFGLAGFAAGAAGRQLVLATRRQGWRGFVGRTNGGMVVHIGVVLLAVGIAASSSYGRHEEFTLSPGQTVEVAGHHFTYERTREVQEKARTSTIAAIRVDGRTMHPALRQFPNARQTVGSPAVASRPTGDIYLALLDSNSATRQITLRVIIEPLVMWIWIGGTVIFLGSFLAAFPGRRRRRGTDPVSASVPDGHVEAAAPPVLDRGDDVDDPPVPAGAPA